MRKYLSPNKSIQILIAVTIFQLNNDLHHVNSRFHFNIRKNSSMLLLYVIISVFGILDR